MITNYKEHYKEIFRLKEKLENAGVPFEFIERKELLGYQIGYPSLTQFECSVIQNIGSYGNEEDLLEIWGLTTEEEGGSILGYLTAEEVYERIAKHYKEVV